MAWGLIEPLAFAMDAYSVKFYETQRGGSKRSAEIVLPNVLQWVRPKKVIDVGCGVGTWLSALGQLGTFDVTGMDGSYVDRSMLQIPKERFFPHDLSKPLPNMGKFDLAMSLETAEHLPPESAEGFVAGLAAMAPVILFSAAAPRQGGTFHFNEQWPEYWAKLFASHGFTAIDCLRERLWNETEIEWWYAQNIFLLVHKERLAEDSVLSALAKEHGAPKALIHPRNYLEKVSIGASYADIRNHPLRTIIQSLPQMLVDWASGKRRRSS